MYGASVIICWEFVEMFACKMVDGSSVLTAAVLEEVKAFVETEDADDVLADVDVCVVSVESASRVDSALGAFVIRVVVGLAVVRVNVVVAARGVDIEVVAVVDVTPMLRFPPPQAQHAAWAGIPPDPARGDTQRRVSSAKNAQPKVFELPGMVIVQSLLSNLKSTHSPVTGGALVGISVDVAEPGLFVVCVEEVAGCSEELVITASVLVELEPVVETRVIEVVEVLDVVVGGLIPPPHIQHDSEADRPFDPGKLPNPTQRFSRSKKSQL